jgi:hypothetical protein
MTTKLFKWWNIPIYIFLSNIDFIAELYQLFKYLGAYFSRSKYVAEQAYGNSKAAQVLMTKYLDSMVNLLS